MLSTAAGMGVVQVASLLRVPYSTVHGRIRRHSHWITEVSDYAILASEVLCEALKQTWGRTATIVGVGEIGEVTRSGDLAG